jgi:hypothetical protein
VNWYRASGALLTAIAREALRLVGWNEPPPAERFDAISEKWRVRYNVHANLGSSRPVEPGRERIRANADASSLLA